ncbi:MAG TPA: YtxH domain-containing protein [Elusimicrobiota bacterium]|jgi:gas vesicle protein|nr:YtxH domain-containing protein [Elusimicrobiota bacterium]HMZ27212.1 YtxH domain-containing protein [Elusimicrobiota bacterium]HNA60493.1 YtxH domain-containing protein [Elusimicrobiota bacterium]HNC74388.1 YtxH domain-containing protein [Elusimicrobiota bacterium]
MSDQNNNGGSLWAFLVGAGLGVAAGLLLAPRSGRESRKRLGRWIEDMEDEGRDMLKEGRDLWERGKTAAQEKTDKIKRTLESVSAEFEDDRS